MITQDDFNVNLRVFLESITASNVGGVPMWVKDRAFQLLHEAKNISSSPMLSKSVCEKYPYPTQMYCYECEGCKKAMSEQTV